MTPPAPMAAAPRYALNTLGTNTHTYLQTRPGWMDWADHCPHCLTRLAAQEPGQFGQTTILTVPHICRPRSLVQQPPSILFLPLVSSSNEATQHVFVAVPQL